MADKDTSRVRKVVTDSHAVRCKDELTDIDKVTNRNGQILFIFFFSESQKYAYESNFIKNGFIVSQFFLSVIKLLWS